MTSTATYSTDGNRLVSTTDALGKVTTYGYNANTNVLDWVQYPEDTENTRTNYTYDDMYRVATVACATDTGKNMSVGYTYTDDYLVKIQTPSTAYNFTYGDFGLRTGVSVGNRTLATYHYTAEAVDDRKNDLDRLDYGNGDRVEYEYDNKGRVTKETYEDGATVQYRYNNDGNLAKVMDSATGRTTTYYYDLTDRMVKYVESGTNYTHSVGYEYDTKNNLTQQVETTNGVAVTTSYTYDEDNRIKTVTTGNTTVTYTYDTYGRTSQKVTKVGSTVHKTEEYTYTGTSTGTSAQIATHKTICGGVTTTYAYTYDDNGNILTVSDGTNTTSYVYDSANQLIRENNQAGGFTHTWEYDNAGNILNRKEYAYTTGELGVPTDADAYTYGDADWGDLLTAYAGNAITHDGIGNPLSDGTWTYTWKHGRQLASMSDGSTTWSYTYDADGLRTKRTNGTDTYSYVYNGSSLSKLTKGSDTLYFTYDANGTPLTVNYNGTVYYYKTNLQGDVTAIVDGNGNTVADYAYDAWGNPIPETGETPTALETLNPLRYRGYVYDEETGLYYVSSRYYDPEIGRFINADAAIGQIGNVQGTNMFAYCFNNPVNMSDPTGNWPKLSTIFTVVAVAAVAVAAVAVTVATCGAAAPALAVAGGGIIGGISAGAAATAASVATGAMIVAGVSTAAAVTSAVAEKAVEKTAKRNNSVYVLKDDAGTVQYVGRTTDVAKRAKAHEANPARAGLKLEVIQPNLNYVQARAVEQAAMAYYHTINTANKMNNQINGISPFNPKLGIYKEAAVGMLGYAWNQVSNEILYWTGY